MATPHPARITCIVLTALATASAPAAFADRKAPAPIEYVGQGQGGSSHGQVPRPNADARQDAWRGPVTTTGSVTLPQTREKLSFAYPGSASAPQQPVRQLASVEHQPRAAEPQSPSRLWPDDVAGASPETASRANQTLVLGESLPPVQQSVASAKPLAASVMPQERGLASWYGEDFHGQPTANGEVFDMNGMTAAHRTLPLPSLVQVINEANGKEIVVRVNDRGPFADDRIIDLSKRAAEALDIVNAGEAPVSVRYLGPAPALQTSPLIMASSEQDGASIEVASLEPALPPRPDLYGEILLGGSEPTLGIPDPGQSVATPKRIAPPPAQVEPPAVRVVQASVPSQPATPQYQPRPQPTQVSLQPEPSRAAASFSPQLFVQVGSFADISNAQGMNAQVGSSFHTDIEPVRVHGADYFRVLVGPFSTRDAAERAKVQLGVRGVSDGFIVVR